MTVVAKELLVQAFASSLANSNASHIIKGLRCQLVMDLRGTQWGPNDIFRMGFPLKNLKRSGDTLSTFPFYLNKLTNGCWASFLE